MSSEPPASRPPAAAPAKPAAPVKQDVVLLGPPTADGAGVHVIRARDQHIETGELRALQEGKPFSGEVLSLKPRESNPRVCDVTQSFSISGHGAPSGGVTGGGAAGGMGGGAGGGAGGAKGGAKGGGAGGAKAHKGPAKVSDDAYRQGWDEIFGAKPKPSGPAN